MNDVTYMKLVLLENSNSISTTINSINSNFYLKRDNLTGIPLRLFRLVKHGKTQYRHEVYLSLIPAIDTHVCSQELGSGPAAHKHF